MHAGSIDLAQVRLDNALVLFEEFVRATARHADAATLRGLERRFAERLQIQPSYWSQIKGRSRQIGERLARQFEHLMHKPRGWMDVVHAVGAASDAETGIGAEVTSQEVSLVPIGDDEKFIIGLVLTYYRRHPQRARARLLDLLGEVLVPNAEGPGLGGASGAPGRGSTARPAGPASEDEHALWLRSQTGVAPLKPRR